MTLTDSDTRLSEPSQEIPPIIRRIFERDTTDRRVICAHGYGIKITVDHGQLAVTDGIGPERRVRKYPKINRELRRIVITGPDGYVSLAALTWCRDHGIAITVIDPAGDLTSAWSPDVGRTDGRLIRNQALSGPTGTYADTGLKIAQGLLSSKITAQAKIIRQLFNKPDVADAMTVYAAKVAKSQTMKELRQHEAHAALWYFGTWVGRVSVPWHRNDIDDVPINWCNYPGRKSLVAHAKRHATDPVNAMLNYCYLVGYSVCRTACIQTGLDPRLGYFHSDDDARDSLALDVLEVIRPDIDRYVLSLLGMGGTMRKFHPRDFTEPGRPYLPGTCRIVAPLTHELAEQSGSWSEVAVSTASGVVRSLLSVSVSGRDAVRPARAVVRDAATRKFPNSATARQVITERHWRVISAVIPEREARAGRNPIDDRIVVAGIAWCMGNGVTYGKAPVSIGLQGATIRRRVADWEAMGVWPEIEAAIRQTVLAQ